MEKITIIKYKSFDGKLFSTQKGCKSYEKDKTTLDKIEKILGNRVKDSSCLFANGNGYVQHDASAVKECWKSLLMFFKNKKYHNDIDKIIRYALEHINLGPNYCTLGRFIDSEYGYGLYVRLMCIDFKTSREYGQPFYALNPDRAVQKELAKA